MFRGDWTPALAELFPDREAIFDVASGRRISYPQLASRVDDAARILEALDVGIGDRVCVLAKNRVETLDLMFACGRLGAILVPLNWRLKEPELRFLLDDCDPTALFFDDEHAFLAGRLCMGSCHPVAFDEAGGATDATFPDSADVPVYNELAAKLRARPTPAQVDIDGDAPWFLLYTSGTTGHPKGALLPHRQVAFNAMNTIIALDLTRSDRTVTYTPLFHTGALHVLTTPLLAKGGSIVLTEGFDAEQVLTLSADQRCTLLFGVPTTFEMMAEADAFTRVDLDEVRVALCGGAPCPVSLIERYAARGITFKQGYGLTEVGPNCLNLREEDALIKAGRAGRPNLHVLAKIVDASGVLVDGPGRGELCLSGPCVCLGYWRRPDANAKAFTSDGYFRTGDIVERDEGGYYTVVDRAKDMFISGGENVYPAEVEKTLSDHDAIRACAVIGVPDARWGEVGRAYLEVRGPVDLVAVKSWLKERLASYKVPKELVIVDELPRNSSGKVQKHLLAGEAKGAAA